jgi:hypothetical protein
LACFRPIIFNFYYALPNKGDDGEAGVKERSDSCRVFQRGSSDARRFQHADTLPHFDPGGRWSHRRCGDDATGETHAPFLTDETDDLIASDREAFVFQKTSCCVMA